MMHPKNILNDVDEIIDAMKHPKVYDFIHLCFLLHFLTIIIHFSEISTTKGEKRWHYNTQMTKVSRR